MCVRIDETVSAVHKITKKHFYKGLQVNIVHDKIGFMKRYYQYGSGCFSKLDSFINFREEGYVWKYKRKAFYG